MDALSRFLLQQPMHILEVALIHFAVWAVLRFGKIRPVRNPNALLLPALAWLAYAAWEWLVLTETPEANIRVDLLVIWPVLGLLSLWTVVWTFWPRRPL